MPITIENGVTIGSGIVITGQGDVPLDLDAIATYLRDYQNVESTSGGLMNPDFYSYLLDGDAYYINDGGGDMFDGGNYTAPALLSGTTYLTDSSMATPPALAYNVTTTGTSDSNFNYVSLGYGTSPDRRPLTMLGTRIGTGDPIGFQKAGGIGADGGGSISNGNLYTGQTFNGFTTYAYYRQTYGAGDPTICDLYLLLGHGAWGSQFGTVQSSVTVDKNYQGAQFRVSGPTTHNVLAIATLLSVDNNSAISTNTLQTITQNYTYLIGQALGI